MKRAIIHSWGIRGIGALPAVALSCLAMPTAASAAPILLPVQAATIVPLLLPSLSSALVADACPAGAMAPDTLLASQIAPVSKASAVLGGTQSALEAMRAQQASLGGLGSLIPGAAAPASVSLSEIRPLSPALAAVAPVLDCAPQATPGLAATIANRPTALPGEFLASRKIAIGRTSFDASWERVSHEKPRFGREARTVIDAGTGLDDRLATVNRWVNHTIAYADDAALFRKADYWAGPQRTLQLGKGDCEDIALLKMHMLLAAGVSRSDMFLTIARDLVRRADHAILIVRTPDGFRMLDNATDAVLDAAQANDYQPVLSFTDRRSFLHGY